MFDSGGAGFDCSSFSGCFQDQPERQNLLVMLREYIERKKKVGAHAGLMQKSYQVENTLADITLNLSYNHVSSLS